jgi:hypothetical protein
LNSDGSVSPCCGIIDENDDFAKYSPSSGFLSAWNSDKFRAARTLASKPEMLWARKDKPNNGVVNICQKCPTGFAPFSVEHEERFFRQLLYERASLFLQKKDLRYLPDLLLRVLISDYSTAIRNVPSLIRRRLSKHKND